MENIGSRMIANEYEFSTSNVKIKVEYHGSNRNTSFNKAEILAQNEEKLKKEKELEKIKQIEEANNKMKENLKLHNKKIKESKKQEEEKKLEKEEKKRKINDYSTTLQNKIKNKLNSSKSIILDNQNVSNISNNNMSSIQNPINNDEIINKNITSNFKSSIMSNNVEDHSDNQWTLAENATELNNNTKTNINSQTVNLRNDIESHIKSQLINKCLKSKDLKQQQCDDEDDSKGDEELNKLREFRKYGKVESIQKTDQSELKLKKNQDDFIDEKIANERQSKQYLQFKKELEKRRLINVNIRYIKALRNVMIEKFKEKNIVIPNICSCGQLQRKLDKIIENKNVSVFSIVNSECANNCIYYNKTQEYHKALSDIISSVKNVKFENFNS